MKRAPAYGKHFAVGTNHTDSNSNIQLSLPFSFRTAQERTREAYSFVVGSSTRPLQLSEHSLVVPAGPPEVMSYCKLTGKFIAAWILTQCEVALLNGPSLLWSKPLLSYPGACYIFAKSSRNPDPEVLSHCAV